MKKIVLIIGLLAAMSAGAAAKVEFGWGESGKHYAEAEKPAFEKAAFKFTAWKGERINAMALVWSDESLSGLKASVNAISSKAYTLPEGSASASFVCYVTGDVLAPGFNQCGKRDTVNWQAISRADRFCGPALDSAPAGKVHPIWISIDVPPDTPEGLYKGSLTLEAEGLCKTLPFSFKVGPRTLTAAHERPFRLDLWQNPYAVARVAGVRPWSPEHFEAMKPVMSMLARAGQKVVTATIIDRPWNGQTEDPFGSMVTKVRRIDGTWLYDFTIFDRWVEFMEGLGIDGGIGCYTMIPWKHEYDFFDQATGKVAVINALPGTPEYEDYWGHFIMEFAAHLKAKGWFEKTSIAMDERGEEGMKAAIAVIHKYEPGMRVSLAGSYHPSIADEIDDYCLAFKESFTEGEVERRREALQYSTYYTCCAERYPNTFIASEPAEACWLAMVAMQKGVDGYLRWAFNSWTADPEHDARFRSWAAGDTYMVYPGGMSSPRFEKLCEGLQDYEKARLLREEWQGDASKAKKLAALEKAIESFNLQVIEASGPIPSVENLRKVFE